MLCMWCVGIYMCVFMMEEIHMCVIEIANRSSLQLSSNHAPPIYSHSYTHTYYTLQTHPSESQHAPPGHQQQHHKSRGQKSEPQQTRGTYAHVTKDTPPLLPLSKFIPSHTHKTHTYIQLHSHMHSPPPPPPFPTLHPHPPPGKST